jgi:transcriptional regulator with GAF, ATPase, and Fis domain
VGQRVDDVTTLVGSSAGELAEVMLVVIGHRHFTTHAITQDRVTIGRAPECDVVLDSRALSRRHAILSRSPELSVQDLDSRNGIRVGGRVVYGGTPVPLLPGESFQIGPFSLLVTSARPADRSSFASGRNQFVVEDPTPAGVSPLVHKIARSNLTVLVLGETGVGKEVLATTIHALSGRSGPCLSLNCANLSETLLESELFGHEKGAFTGAVTAKQGMFEAAHGGTVFLDEIGEIPLALQAKLLRTVELREIRRVGSTRTITGDVRLIAATNRDLSAEINAGRFRQDLYFRLEDIILRIPPLRERRHAIGPLAVQFIEEAAREAGRPEVSASLEVMSALAAYDWPGNVRQLRTVIRRAVLLSQGAELRRRHLVFSPVGDAGRAPSPASPSRLVSSIVPDDLGFLTPEQLLDRARLVAALDACAGNQTRAARLLGIGRTALVQKMSLYRIPRPRT